MAVGTGIGIDLSAMDKAFREADKHIKNLTDKTNGLSKQTIEAFQQMTKNGVLPYVQSLKQQKKALEEIGKAKGSGAFFTKMQKEAKVTVDEINKVISSLEKTKAFRNESSGRSAMSFAKSVLGKGGEAKSIDNMRLALSKLEEAQNRQNLGTARGRQNYEKIGETIRKVKGELDKATGSNQRLREESEKTKEAFRGLGNIISAAFAINVIRRFINEMIKVRGEFEMQHRSLQVLLKDKEAADALWDKTVQLAVKSPFRVRDLVTYTKNLAAYRVEADKLYETNKMLADVSAGLGVDMNRLILAFGQVKAANFLRGTELRQFSEAGVNMLEELAKRFTMLEGRAVSVGEVFERVSKRMVSFKDVEAVFKTITSEGGVFYQMQEKQSETLKGMIMNLKDSIDLAFNNMGESNEGLIKNSIALVRELVENWEKFKPVINGITIALVTTLVGHGIAKVIAGVKMAYKAFDALWAAIRTGSKLATVGAGPWIALATILVGIVTTIIQAVNSANRLQKELNKLYAEDTQNLDKAIARYQDLINRLRETNQGSQERRDIIEKLNNEYGKYLDFIVTEQTEINRLVDSYDVLVKRMKEKAATATYEKAFAQISDEYTKKIQKAQDNFAKILSGENFFMNEIPLEAYGLMQKGKNLFGGATAASITPAKNEINDIYSILEQRLENITEEEEKQLKNIEAQKKLINSIISSYYGEEFYIRFAEGDKDIDIIETILEKKEKEREIEEQISRAYQESLHSRAARLEYDKLELEYTQRQAEIRAMEDTSPFEVKKMLDKLREEFELNKIEIKFKFGQIGEAEYDRLRNSILNWATDTTKDVNNQIRRELSNFMTESEWSNFLITPDQQAQGVSGIIKEITNGYETQVNVIKEQISLKSAGRKIDEKGLEFAEKQKRAYEAVANILGIELKTQDRISDSLLKQINDLMPAKQKLSLEDSYKSVKEIQDETNKAYKEQVETMTTLINQKRAGVTIDFQMLEASREDLEILREKMKLLGMKVDEPMSETTRNSINYELPEEFKISEADALKGVVAINKEAASAFEAAQNELSILLRMEDEEREGLEDRILLLQSELPYLQRKVELTGTYLKDRLTEQQLDEINSQLDAEHQLNQINLYKDRSAVIAEVKAKEDEIAESIRQAYRMSENQLSLKEDYIKKLEEEYLIQRQIRNQIDPETEKAINKEKVDSINAKLQEKYRIGVLDSVKGEATLLSEANAEKEKAIAYEAQLAVMKKRGVAVTKEELAAAKEATKQWTLRWKLLGGVEDKKGGDSQNSLYDERIKVIDDMNKKYRELAKTLPDVEAKQGAFNAYIDAFAEAYKGIKWVPANVKQMTPEQFVDQVLNFPNEDALVAFLDKLAKEPMKAFEKIKVELAKGEYVLDMKVRLQKDADKKVIEEVENMFDEYSLSLDIKKLNLPPELAKELFGLDTRNLKDLREGINQAFMGVEFYEERIKDAGKIMEETFNGNVDLLNRKLVPAQELAAKGWEDVGDGLATVFSSSYSVTDASGKEIDILVTPILPDGTVMSQNELEKYISTKIEGAKNVLDADDKGIIIHASTDMDEGMGEYLHSLQEVFYASDMLSEDQKKKYKEFIDKVRDLELKEQEDRLKMYVEYAKKGISERAKIKLEELRKLSEIEKTFKPEATKEEHDIEKAKAEGATDEQIKILEEENKKIREGNKAVEERNALLAEQGRLASEAVRKESQEQTNKLEWEEFEKSDMFIRVFDDLDAASSSLLEHMISKIQDFKDEWTDMPLEDVEKIVDALNKLQLKLAESNPWGEFKKAKKDLEDAKKAVKFEDAEAKTLAEKGGEGNYMAALDKEDVAQQEKRDNAIEQIALLETQLAITEKIVATTDEERDIKSGLVSQIKKELTTQEGIKKSAEDNLKATGKVRAEHKRVKTALAAQYSATSECLNMAVELGGAISDLVGTLTDDDPAMVFAEMGLNMLTTVANTLALQAQLIAAQGAATGLGAAMNTAAGVIGWIVMAIQLLVTAISAAVNYADKMRQMSMDVLAGQVEHLKNKFDELAESIEEAWSYKQLEEYSKELDKVQKKMVSTQKQYVQLLRSGKDSEKTIATAEAAQAKLDAGASVDSLSKKEKKALLSEEYEAYKQATEDLAEMEENYADQKKELIEELGGVSDPKEAAEEFVDAWLEAYKETGDGLSGLDEKFDEFFENLIKKKAAMLVAEKALTGWVDAVNNALDMESSGGADITSEEQEAINKAAEDAKEKANKILLGIFEGMDFGEAEGEGLSGLQKGIQGITEDQADILAAYWNSVRGYTASIDAKFDALLASMGVSLENPQLVEMRNQSVILGEINLKMEAMNAIISGLVDASGKLKVHASTQLDGLIKPRANGGVGLNIVND